MTARSRLASDEPSSPALGDRAAMIGQVVAEPGQHGAIDSARNALGQKAGHVQRRIRVVAAQTRIVAKHRRWSGDGSKHAVKDGALRGIVRSNLDEAAAHPGHDDRVVEIDDARTVRKNALLLKAGLREDDDL